MSQRQSNQVRKSPLLLLSLWLGLGGVSPMVYAQETAPEIAPEIAPESVTPTEPAPSEPVPEVVLPAFDPVPEPEPTAVAPAPEAVAPEPEPAIPEAITPEPELNIPSAATEAPAVPEQAQSDLYIDTQDYSVGATEPYIPPSEVVVNERSSGCQAVVSAETDSSLCAPPPALQRYAAPNPISDQAPVADRWTAPPDRWLRNEPVASAQTVQESLNYTVVPRDLAIKPLTGANPLKWIMQNGERMIFPLPIPVDITSAFGWRNHPITGEWRFHSGTDLGAPMGTPVLAAYSGKVSLAEMLGGYGLSILLDHNQGQQETRYAHLSEIYVKPGQWVKQGTVIGLVGSTGNSTGPHLHFEALQMLPDGTTVSVDSGSELQTTLTQLAQMLQTARLTAQKPVTPAQMQNQQSQS